MCRATLRHEYPRCGVCRNLWVIPEGAPCWLGFVKLGSVRDYEDIPIYYADATKTFALWQTEIKAGNSQAVPICGFVRLLNGPGH